MRHTFTAIFGHRSGAQQVPIQGHGATILIPSSMVDSLNPSAAALTPGASAPVTPEVVWDKAAA